MDALHGPVNSRPDAVQILMTRGSLENPTCLIGSRERGGDSQIFTNTQIVKSPPPQRPIAPGGPASLVFLLAGPFLGHRVVVSHHWSARRNRLARDST